MFVWCGGLDGWYYVEDHVDTIDVELRTLSILLKCKVMWQARMVINSFYEFSFGCEIRTVHCTIFCLGLFNRASLENDIRDTWMIIDPLIFML